MPGIVVDESNADIMYEVAIEKLGGYYQTLYRLIREENERSNPSNTAIDYYKSKFSLIQIMQDRLRSEETELIQRILNDEFVY